MNICDPIIPLPPPTQSGYAHYIFLKMWLIPGWPGCQANMRPCSLKTNSKFSFTEHSRTWVHHVVHIVYVIESAAYGALCTSCLCQKPERARNERVRVFDTNNEWIKPRTKHFLCRELFITHNMRIFIKIVFWTRIRNKNSLTIEPNANLI